MAGRDVTDNLNNLLRRSGYLFIKTVYLDLILLGRVRNDQEDQGETLFLESNYDYRRKVLRREKDKRSIYVAW